MIKLATGNQGLVIISMMSKVRSKLVIVILSQTCGETFSWFSISMRKTNLSLRP